MADKKPVRAVFNDSGVATGLAEFQSGDTVGLTHGGLGASLSIGSAGQVLKVNSGASALEFGNVEAIVNIDGATDKTSATLATTDLLLASDGGTEGRVTLAQLDTLFSGTSKTLTNKTLTSPALTTPAITGNTTTTGDVIFEGSTSDSFETTLTVVDPTADRTISLPNATDTLVGKDTTDTLTNKTLTNPVITNITGSSITLDSAGDVNLDADGADVILKDGGTEYGRFTNNSGELQIKSGSSSTTNMTMSGANTTVAGNLTVTGTTTFNGGTITLGDAATDTVAFNGTISTNLIFEGSTDDSFETTLAPGNPSADVTLTLPTSTGTIATTTDVFFDNSTTTTHPAADGNADLAGGESPFESITDAFGVITGTSYDMMNPKGSNVTIDLGSVA